MCFDKVLSERKNLNINVKSAIIYQSTGALSFDFSEDTVEIK
jgi:hypothetical protein